MANDLVKLEILNENKDKHLDSEIERIFGMPSAPNGTENNGFLRSDRNEDQPFNGLNGESDSGRTTQPLLEAPRDRQLPPLAGPEIDDLDGDPPKDANPFTGIDDGLLEPSDKKPDSADPDDGEHDPERDSGEEHHTLRTNLDGVVGTDGKTEWEHDEPDYPYGDWNTRTNTHSNHTLDVENVVDKSHSYLSGLGPRYGIDDRGVSPIPGIVISLEIRSPGRSGLNGLKGLVVFLPQIVLNLLIFFISFFKVIPDVNTYQQKKNLAQGMMDLALLSANANQLRYVLESSTTHPYYYSSVTFISLSIIFQILVGVGLIMNSRYDVNNHKDICKADKINNMTVLGIFLITIVNVFITSFSVATPTAGAMLRGQLVTNITAPL